MTNSAICHPVTLACNLIPSFCVSGKLSFNVSVRCAWSRPNGRAWAEAAKARIVSEPFEAPGAAGKHRPVRILAVPHPADLAPAHGRSRGRQARSRRSAGMVRLRRARRRPTGRGIPSASGRPPFRPQHQRWKRHGPRLETILTSGSDRRLIEWPAGVQQSPDPRAPSVPGRPPEGRVATRLRRPGPGRRYAHRMFARSRYPS